MYEFDDLSGQEFGIWKVLKFDHMQYNGERQRHGMSYYKCKCKNCGIESLVARSQLLQNKNKKHYGCKVRYEKTI